MMHLYLKSTLTVSYDFVKPVGAFTMLKDAAFLKRMPCSCLLAFVFRTKINFNLQRRHTQMEGDKLLMEEFLESRQN